MNKLCLGLLVGFTASLCAAHASTDPDALAYFEAGAFEEAVEQAIAAGGAENLALAARALNAKAYLEIENKPARKLAKRALRLAEDAIETDPAVVEGHLQAAISYAQRGSRMAPFRAFLSGAAGKARAKLDVSLSLEPANPWALSSSAAWHLEVSRRAGEGKFGSVPMLGFEQFRAAREAAPDNLPIAYECALRLIAYDNPDWREEALAALEDAVGFAPQNEFERKIQDRALDLQRAVSLGQEAERAFIDAQP